MACFDTCHLACVQPVVLPCTVVLCDAGLLPEMRALYEGDFQGKIRTVAEFRESEL